MTKKSTINLFFTQVKYKTTHFFVLFCFVFFFISIYAPIKPNDQREILARLED